MVYRRVTKATFISRPNRFIAQVADSDGQVMTVHVKKTGRCRELLIPGCTVYLAHSDNPARKTPCDLIAVEKRREGKPPLMVNMDAQAPNAVAEAWLRAGQGTPFSPNAKVRREVSWGNSRFDLYVEDGQRRAFVEVKGVTLEHDGVASFPDAPTERGVKHLRELMACMNEGYEAYVLFVIQMKEIHVFRPNDATHPAFGEALRGAAAAGVHILAMDCIVTPHTLTIDTPVRVVL